MFTLASKPLTATSATNRSAKFQNWSSCQKADSSTSPPKPMCDLTRDIPVAANMRYVLASLFVNSTSSSCSLPWSWSFTQQFLQKHSSTRPNRSTSPRCLCTWDLLPEQPCCCVLDGPSQHVDFLHILGAPPLPIAILEFMLTFQQLEDEVKVVVQTHVDEIVTVDDTKQVWGSPTP